MTGWTHDLTNDTAHRPYPMPAGPWLMSQSWSNLLFAHWPVDVAALRGLVPSALPLDTFDGAAWVSVVPFYLSHLRPRWMPALPLISEFPELNVRTYVTLGGKPGVYFFSLDAGSALAVAAARVTYYLPYFNARMTQRVAADGMIHYASQRADRRGRQARFDGRYRPTGPVNRSTPGTIDHWLTERYCLYAVDRRAHVYRGEIHHRQWPLQPAAAEIETNTMASASDIQLPSREPRLSFSSRLDVIVWPPQRVSA